MLNTKIQNENISLNITKNNFDRNSSSNESSNNNYSENYKKSIINYAMFSNILIFDNVTVLSLNQSKAVVGTPVFWEKKIVVNNIASVQKSLNISTEIFHAVDHGGVAFKAHLLLYPV